MVPVEIHHFHLDTKTRVIQNITVYRMMLLFSIDSFSDGITNFNLGRIFRLRKKTRNKPPHMREYTEWLCVGVFTPPSHFPSCYTSFILLFPSAARSPTPWLSCHAAVVKRIVELMYARRHVRSVSSIML